MTQRLFSCSREFSLLVDFRIVVSSYRFETDRSEYTNDHHSPVVNFDKLEYDASIELKRTEDKVN